MATQTQKYNKLAGKHVLIIGGTSGLGYCVAEACIESSAHVTISSSSAERVQSCIEKLKSTYPSTKVNINGYACDLSKPTVEEDITTLFKKINGILDHIVYTAGDRLAQMKIEDITYEKILKAGQIRFFAPLLVAKVGSKYLNKGPESSITLTTGSVADRPTPNWTIVASYASGLHGMTRNLALDLKPIRVNVVSPGAVDTELWKDMSEEQKKGFVKSVSDKVPTGRIGQPEDVAEAYLWLMKDSNATGIVATSNSGHLLV